MVFSYEKNIFMDKGDIFHSWEFRVEGECFSPLGRVSSWSRWWKKVADNGVGEKRELILGES